MAVITDVTVRETTHGGESLLPHPHPLASRVEREVLPFVSRPGRYVGNEWGAVHKEHAGKVKVCLAFPDAYELGMSYLGTAILGNLINREPDCVAERVFSPWPDMEDRLRQTRLPLFSLESFTPLSEFHVVGFSLSYELQYSNVLTMLDLSHIPLRSRDRTEEHPIVVAGGSIVYNPEPMAAFIDLFVIGDGEDVIREMLPPLRELRDGRIDRREAIRRLAALEGVYYPERYSAAYDAESWFERIEPVTDDAPRLVKSRQTLELKNEYYPETPIVPFIEIAHDRLSVEIMRGCVRNCRFCQAGYIYLPKRGRTVPDLIRHTLDSLNRSGWDEVTLLSLLSTDFKGLDELADQLADRLVPRRVALSLPSIRPGTFSIEMAQKIAQVRRTGLTFAPEAGSHRLRRVINKMISDDDMVENAKAAFAAGWRQIKLYFMIGLPGERDEDLDGIVLLVRKILTAGREQGTRPQINITISPFAPKSHTPFQWEPQDSTDEIHRKHALLRQKMRRMPVRLKLRDPQVSFLEGVLGRGDRRFAEVIEGAWRRGARFDAWQEWFRFDYWRAAFAEAGLDPARWAGRLDVDRPLPWAHIDKGNLTTDFLLRQRERAYEAMARPDDEPLGSEEMPFAGPASETPGPPREQDRARVETVFPQFVPDEESGFGRRPKRRAPAGGQQVAPTKSRIRVRWQKQAPVRFTSHLDCIRTFERAIRRADWPVAYSEGFNPHMKLSFGPPLPLGFVSDDEYFDVQLEAVFTDRHFRKLLTSLPRGFLAAHYQPVYGTGQSLVEMLNRADYHVTVTGALPDAEERVGAFLQSDSHPVTRARKKTTVNIRPSVIGLRSLHEGERHDYWFTLKIGEPAVAKPFEVISAITGFGEETAVQAQARRLRLYTSRGNREFSPFDSV